MRRLPECPAWQSELQERRREQGEHGARRVFLKTSSGGDQAIPDEASQGKPTLAVMIQAPILMFLEGRQPASQFPTISGDHRRRRSATPS
jgi:hypothetical protein